MTTEDFRRIALSMPEATESAHMGHPDFRVRGKIFATIWPAEGWGMVKLTPEQQREFVLYEPTIFAPVKGGWGLRGATTVRLEEADKATVRRAVGTAWRNTAPKKLVQRLGLEKDTDRKSLRGDARFERADDINPPVRRRPLTKPLPSR